MICKNINATLVLSISYLLHSIQELFCDDDKQREQAIVNFREHEIKLVKGFAYILSQAEQFHQFKLSKGGKRDGNGSIVSMAAQKRVS